MLYLRLLFSLNNIHLNCFLQAESWAVSIAILATEKLGKIWSNE